MPYRIAGIDVHKKMLAIVVADIEVDGDFQFERQKAGTTPSDLRGLAAWLVAQEVEEVVMESTAQYWRPVREALEQHWRPQRRGRAAAPRLSGTLHLAQAQSNRGPGGRKKDFPDAERLVKRLVAQELTLSFVPGAEQRLWRTVMRRKYQITRNRVQLHNRLEALASWMGACPGNEESAGVNYSHRCPKGNRQMRRVLNQAANAAVKAKGTIFAVVYRRIVPRLGHAQAIGAITHRLCRLIWKILHERVRYEERGPAVSVEAKKVCARKMIRELRGLGYRVELVAPAPTV
jgi:Transposase/Transposase IS116/IS110/IS902 family